MVVQKLSAYTGQDLRDMLAAATAWLEKCARDIDALNVFPVPDGDTGTNMLLTLRSMLEACGRSPDFRAGRIAEVMAQGALMGARGNSGVILAQIVRGISQELAGKETFHGQDMARALEAGAVLAYKGISHPVEGTMLTVVREAAAAACKAAAANGDLSHTLEAALDESRASVARTPSLLPVLKQAGVVDAGGQGLYVLMEGMLRFLRGEPVETPDQKPQIISAGLPPGLAVVDEKPYGYCTEFLLQGQRLDLDRLREWLEAKGESVIAVGDGSTIRVHIHTYRPGQVLSYAARRGTLHDISIRNMDDQHQEYLRLRQSLLPPVAIAIVAVASGKGLAQVFCSLGASVIVPGGHTMNPSTQEIMQGIEAAPSQQVVLLPNNKNVIPAAQQAASLTAKKVLIVPTETIPQGVSALLAFNLEADLEANSAAMSQAKSRVHTIALSQAVRPARLGDLKVRTGQALGFLDEDLVGVANDFPQTLEKALVGMDLKAIEAITVYCGDGAKPTGTNLIEALLRQYAPGAEIEVVEGGQPHYPYIISLE